jgi:hypothetical protein
LLLHLWLSFYFSGSRQFLRQKATKIFFSPQEDERERKNAAKKIRLRRAIVVLCMARKFVLKSRSKAVSLPNGREMPQGKKLPGRISQRDFCRGASQTCRTSIKFPFGGRCLLEERIAYKRQKNGLAAETLDGRPGGKAAKSKTALIQRTPF